MIKAMENKKVFIVYKYECYYGISELIKVFYNEKNAINFIEQLKITVGENLIDYEECEIQ